MRIVDSLTALVFATFLLAPAMSLLGFGYDQDAENTVILADIDLAKLIETDRTYRDDVIDRALLNSPVGMHAIRTKNWFDYGVFGFIKTDQVISGEDNWLFYLPGFENGKCTEPRRIRWAIDKTEAFSHIAAASGTNFLFSVSPDKSTVAESSLGPRATIAAGCKLNNARAWRQYAKASGAGLLDHFEALQHSTADMSLYYRTDTHWNELGGSLALRQIASMWLDKDIGHPQPGSGTLLPVDTDLRTGMLRLPIQETTESYPDYWENVFPEEVGNGVRGSVIVHDSFYKRIIGPLKTLFPDGQFFDLNHPDPDSMRQAIAARPAYLLVNSVERRLIPRLVSQNYSWNSPLGMGLIDANEDAARTCQYRSVELADVRFAKMEPSTNPNQFTTLKDPKLYVRLLGGTMQPCIRIRFSTSSSSVSQLFLPVDADGNIREGMSVNFFDKIEPDRLIELVLPTQYAGTTIRFDPDIGESTIDDLFIEVGQTGVGTHSN